MNPLYTPEYQKNDWGYNTDVGIIPKHSGNSEYDSVQDQKIESNKSQIQETKQSLRANDARDNAQQAQIDANDALDIQQQSEIDANKLELASNKQRDDQQQSQIDDTITRLNANILDDERQQNEINENKASIARLEAEMPTLEVEGTTLIIGKKP